MIPRFLRGWLIIIALPLISICVGQNDVIYKKDGGYIACKVKEITLDVIKYERIDVVRGPTIEIRKTEAYKIKYKSGSIEILDRDFKPQKTDTSGYSIIYVTYNSGQSNQKFPIIINGINLCTMHNHSRLIYKMFTEGEISVCRYANGRKQLCGSLEIEHGKKYALRIELLNEQAIDPNKKFSLTFLSDQSSVIEFFNEEYRQMKPYKEDDYHFTERVEK